MPVIGFLHVGSAAQLRGQIAGFHHGLKEARLCRRPECSRSNTVGRKINLIDCLRLRLISSIAR